MKVKVKVDEKKLVPAGAFGASVFIHIAILFLIGGIVLIEKVIPKAAMTGDMAVEQTAPNPEPEAEESPTEPLPNEPTPDTPSIPQKTDDSMANLIATETVSPTQTMVMTSSVTTMAIGNSMTMGSTTGSATGKLSAAKGKASPIDFFGVKGSARRVAFLLDASGSMVTVQHNGKEGYAKLKDDLNKMVQALDPETSFCVFIFDSTVDQFRSSDVLATPENKKAFTEWLAPYMTKGFGNLLHNYKTDHLKGYTGTTRLDLALTAAFESGCDSIFILTDGTPSVVRPLTDKELSEWEKLHEKNAKEIEAAAKVMQDYKDKNKDLIAQMYAEVKRRNDSVDGRQKEIEYWIDGYKGLPPRPNIKAPPGMWKPQPPMTDEDLIEYLQKLFVEIYQPISQEKPSINIVGYGVTKEDSEFLKKMTKKFGGSYSDFKFAK